MKRNDLIATLLGMMVLCAILIFAMWGTVHKADGYLQMLNQQELQIESRDRMISIQLQEIERLKSESLTDERIETLLQRMKNQNDSTNKDILNKIDEIIQEVENEG